jgi:RNA-directed DNA polymerase
MSLQSRIASELFLSPQFVSLVTRSASKRYKSYLIPKRTGGYRTIFHPARDLKALQRWLNVNVIATWTVHNAAAAYRLERSIRDNADLHKNSDFLLKLDFDSFFPSISAHDLRSYLESGPADQLQWNDHDIWTFLSIVCRNDQLTIGAPTSPMLSNVVCHELDCRLTAWSNERGVTYTRYADDITFSCNAPDLLKNAPKMVEDMLKDLPIPRNLRLNKLKPRNLSRKHRRVVTGIVLTPTGELSIGRHVKRKLRSLIHSYGDLSFEQRLALAGLLSYAVSIEPDLLNRLVLKFGPDLIQHAKKPLSSNEMGGS